jgi:hypothetical protein
MLWKISMLALAAVAIAGTIVGIVYAFKAGAWWAVIVATPLLISAGVFVKNVLDEKS